jgi:hypothetical protein
VTVSLIGAGAAIGALCGGVLASLALLLTASINELMSRDTAVFLGLCATVGGVVGGITAPIVSWGLLRRVPLGRAIAWGAIGTMLGGVIGEWVSPANLHGGGVPGVIIGGFLGFVAASIAVRTVSGRAASVTSTKT